LICRGYCSFDIKAHETLIAGAEYVLFYNNVPRLEVNPDVEESGIYAAGIVDAATGATFVKLLAAGKTVKASFGIDRTLIIPSPGPVNNVIGGTMSTFNTWNPTNENTIKPVVSAPGGNILSTYPRWRGEYGVESGTSMATPFIAGVIALYKQAKGKSVSPSVINATLSSTAVPLDLTSVAQQGGGLVDAYHMINAGITVDVANLALNDTANHVKNAAFYVQKTGTTTQNYVLTHQLALTPYTFASGGDVYDVTVFQDVTLDTTGASAVITPSTLTLKPGEKKRITAAIVPDPSLEAGLVPVYSSYINISTTTGSEAIHLPYLGVAIAMYSIAIMNTRLSYPYWYPLLEPPNTTTIEVY
jgi:subtilisin family serine protease